MERFSYQILTILTAGVLVAAAPATAATIVDVDYVLLSYDGVGALADGFDDGTLPAADWPIQIGVSSADESGTFLNMDGGDEIARPIFYPADADTNLSLQADLTSFPAGSELHLILYGAAPNGAIQIILTDTAAATVINGALEDFDPVTLGSSVNLAIDVTADGVVTFVDGVEIFGGPGPTGFMPDGIGVKVVPEPASAMIALLGLGFLARRKRQA